MRLVECPGCGMDIEATSFAQHASSVHIGGADRLYACGECEWTGPSLPAALRHALADRHDPARLALQRPTRLLAFAAAAVRLNHPDKAAAAPTASASKASSSSDQGLKRKAPKEKEDAGPALETDEPPAETSPDEVSIHLADEPSASPTPPPTLEKAPAPQVPTTTQPKAEIAQPNPCSAGSSASAGQSEGPSAKARKTLAPPPPPASQASPTSPPEDPVTSAPVKAAPVQEGPGGSKAESAATALLSLAQAPSQSPHDPKEGLGQAPSQTKAEERKESLDQAAAQPLAVGRKEGSSLEEGGESLDDGEDWTEAEDAHRPVPTASAKPSPSASPTATLSGKTKVRCALCLSRLRGVRVNVLCHVVSCVKLKPFQCTHCGLLGGRRTHIADHCRAPGECSEAGATVAVADAEADDEAMRHGLARCFPAHHVPFAGFR